MGALKERLHRGKDLGRCDLPHARLGAFGALALAVATAGPAGHRFLHDDGPVFPRAEAEGGDGGAEDRHVGDLEGRGHVQGHAVVADHDGRPLGDPDHLPDACFPGQVDDRKIMGDRAAGVRFVGSPGHHHWDPFGDERFGHAAVPFGVPHLGLPGASRHHEGKGGLGERMFYRIGDQRIGGGEEAHVGL